MESSLGAFLFWEEIMSVKKLLMGNEAIGIAALNAGVGLISGYPGTPSSEILETAAKYNDGSVHIEWSVNEKVALEVGAGAAYAGARVMVTMKQVGLNVASDPLMSLAYIGVKGGMIIVVADDPGPISSQTEQDTRLFAQFCKLPVFDPTTPEEAYSMIADAFDLSEKLQIPVIFRPTTRICHACASIDFELNINPKKAEGFIKDPKWAIFPSLSYRNHIKLEKIAEEIRNSDEFKYNQSNNIESETAVVAGGVSYSYIYEVLNQLNLLSKVKLIKLGQPWPSPDKFLLNQLDGVNRVIVAEELDPVIEDNIYKLNLPVVIHGKRDHTFPYAGEYSFELAVNVLCKIFNIINIKPKETDYNLPVRPPVLCAGCPHRASFYAVKSAMKGINSVFSGDIGCYTLGNAKPLNMVDTCLCMGAGITIAQGLQHIEPDVKHFAFIGDSTFFHSGITGIVNAVYNKANVNIMILDNSTTAMTGQQPHPGTGKTMMGEIADIVDIEAIIKACGVKFVRKLNPFDQKKAIDTVKEATEHDGVSVIIFESPCISLIKKTVSSRINDKCTKCRRCINEIGCPAFITGSDNNIYIDKARCMGCGLCKNICKAGAIEDEV